MSVKMAAWALLVALVASAIPNVATAAYGPYFSYHGPWAYGYYQQDRYRQSAPYFALYPPVYYSYPVARPYGYSPYAWLPGTVAASEARPIRPLLTRNPYVPSEVVATLAAPRQIPTPRRMSNPYAQ